MTDATWESCQQDLAHHFGGLLDLLVPGTNDADWERFWAALRAGPFPFQTLRDGEPIPPPESAAWIFAERETVGVIVRIDVHGLQANCHFFGGELEVDLDPREITGETAFASMLHLQHFLATTLNRPAFAAFEGDGAARAFVQMTPDGQSTYLWADRREEELFFYGFVDDTERFDDNGDYA
jgi:hypothetical protein